MSWVISTLENVIRAGADSGTESSNDEEDVFSEAPEGEAAPKYGFGVHDDVPSKVAPVLMFCLYRPLL